MVSWLYIVTDVIFRHQIKTARDDISVLSGRGCLCILKYWFKISDCGFLLALLTLLILVIMSDMLSSLIDMGFSTNRA